MLAPTRNIPHFLFQIDNNRINSRQRLQFMNQLEQWYRKEIINILMSEPAVNEANQGSRKEIQKQKADCYIHSMNVTGYDPKMFEEVSHILFPDQVIDNNNKRNDIDIVLHAIKIGAILITDEGASKNQPGGMLGKALVLKERFGLKIMRDSEAVELVKQAIQERDRLAIEYSSIMRQPLPDWVGKD